MELQKDYFESYGDLEVHRIMLKDEPRCMAYGKAILSNEHLIRDKIVMDVGAGTGILSLFCAKAGAKRVYAVEGSNEMVQVMKKVVAENDCDKIVVVEGDVEDVELDVKVDVLVSEWMGFTLLHEGMLSSVLVARDRFLKEDGIILPESCRLNVSLCKTPSLFDDYENYKWVNMGHFGREWRSIFDGKPEIYALKETDTVISNTETILNFDIKKIQLEDLEMIKKHVRLEVAEETFCDALCFWFEVNLLGHTLSTSPLQPETHWKQTLIVLPERLNVRKGNSVDFELSMEQEKKRRYIINVDKFDWKENS